jgi:hypothetical protein
MRDESDDIAFVKEAFALLGTRRILLPALLLALLLAFGDIAIASTLPTARDPDSLPYLLAFLLLLLGVVAFSVAILRILNGSGRPPWQPDASLGLYGIAFIASIVIGIWADMLVGGREDLLGGLAGGVLATIVRAPLAPWFVAIAVERPLAWHPGPYMRRFRTWLPSLLLWGLLIVVPLGQLHLMINREYLPGPADWSWPVTLVEAALGAALELVALGLASVAYRRVARS